MSKPKKKRCSSAGRAGFIDLTEDDEIARAKKERKKRKKWEKEEKKKMKKEGKKAQKEMEISPKKEKSPGKHSNITCIYSRSFPLYECPKCEFS